MTHFFEDESNGTFRPAEFDPEIQKNYEEMIASGATEEEAIFFSSKIVDNNDYSSVDPELLIPRQKRDERDALMKRLKTELHEARMFINTLEK